MACLMAWMPDGPIGHGSCITILVAGVGTSFTVHTCGCGRSGLIAHWDPIASHLIHGEVMPMAGQNTRNPKPKPEKPEPEPEKPEPEKPEPQFGF